LCADCAPKRTFRVVNLGLHAIHKALGVEIPGEDYGKIANLEDAIAYVAARL
jgi:acyl carrier protein